MKTLQKLPLRGKQCAQFLQSGSNASFQASSNAGKMSYMLMTPSRFGRLALCIASAAIIASLPSSSARAESSERYVFSMDRVELANKIPKSVAGIVRSAAQDKIKATERLLAAIPEGAPDPTTAPKKFRAFMSKRRLRAFKVNVEVTAYSLTIEPATRGQGKNVAVHVALRMFGETVPGRSMGFTGSGSATIKMGVGSKVRDRDKEVANRDAVKLAIDDALTTSIRKLDTPAKKKKKKRRR